MSIPLLSASLYNGQVFVWSNCLLDLGTDFLVGNTFFVRDALYLAVAPISMACILLWSSAVWVHDSQAYRKMGLTRERISRILELREIFLPFQTGFNLVSAAVVCAILDSISGLEPSSVITELRHVKFEIVSSFCPCHWCCLSSAWSSRHLSPCRRLWRLCRDAQLILIVLPPLLLSHRCHQQSGDW